MPTPSHWIWKLKIFACNFCNHIFTANLEQQLLRMADSQLPLTWRWNGKTWKNIQLDEIELNWIYGLAGAIFVLLPTMIIGISAYLFPPISGSYLSWLPTAWAFLTFLAHLVCLVWLVLEYYQFPLVLYLITIGQRLFLRRG